MKPCQFVMKLKNAEHKATVRRAGRHFVLSKLLEYLGKEDEAVLVTKHGQKKATRFCQTVYIWEPYPPMEASNALHSTPLRMPRKE